MRSIMSALVALVAAPCSTASGQVFAKEVVDVPPERLKCAPPQYPRVMQEANIEGSVFLQFVVETNGRVMPETIEVLRSTHEAFELPAREMLAGCQFRPGYVRGMAVRVLVEMPLAFNLRTPVSVSPIAQRDTLALRRSLPDAADISPGAWVRFEGPVANSLPAGMAGDKAIVSWQRIYDSTSGLLRLGSSALHHLEVTVASFATAAEAQEPLEVMERSDPAQLLGMMLGMEGGSGIRTVGRDTLLGIGDRASAWTLEMRLGLDADVYLAVVARARVMTTLVAAAGPGGLVPADLHEVLAFVDRRIPWESRLAEDLVPDVEESLEPTLTERPG